MTATAPHLLKAEGKYHAASYERMSFHVPNRVLNDIFTCDKIKHDIARGTNGNNSLETIVETKKPFSGTRSNFAVHSGEEVKVENIFSSYLRLKKNKIAPVSNVEHSMMNNGVEQQKTQPGAPVSMNCKISQGLSPNDENVSRDIIRSQLLVDFIERETLVSRVEKAKSMERNNERVNSYLAEEGPKKLIEECNPFGKHNIERKKESFYATKCETGLGCLKKVLSRSGSSNMLRRKSRDVLDLESTNSSLKGNYEWPKSTLPEEVSEMSIKECYPFGKHNIERKKESFYATKCETGLGCLKKVLSRSGSSNMLRRKSRDVLDLESTNSSLKGNYEWPKSTLPEEVSEMSIKECYPFGKHNIERKKESFYATKCETGLGCLKKVLSRSGSSNMLRRKSRDVINSESTNSS
eukprot:CAMPEP_0172520372 /NCGR_PEP_ID=MMETSP1066-20121228/291963_1 /TAXON_ID=671091 /ORGANISM="Coscinodiscus wailesii, Strain CCMP2513" /LENGTH=408 /DNA_ID=CAMNT_0013303117 /DNA_START=65 /DNA_END=1288 /DNA_ORIENTATION=-